ncbi:MAG: hypothetical protein HY901_30375, partial [Deltaproteobacteria bacterium]|nr:hypothetical protein [Deltaproteobacteria bacterium]
PTTVDRYSDESNHWQTEALGVAGRSGNNNTMWRVNTYKSIFFVEITLKTSLKTDTVGHDAGVAIVSNVLGKIP